MTTARLAPVSRPADHQVVEALPRLAYIDNLRMAVIAVVIVHHAAQAYGSTESVWAIPNPTQAVILQPFLAINASFGMALMSLLAGYLTPHAYDHRGAHGLLRERAVRLVVPMLLISLGLLLPYAYLTQGRGESILGFVLAYLHRPEVGHMWFAGCCSFLPCVTSKGARSPIE